MNTLNNPAAVTHLCRFCGRSVVTNRAAVVLFASLMTGTALAVDLEAFTGLEGPLLSALTKLAELTPGLKALVGFIGFAVAFISLAALRNFSPVLYYIGMAIFGSVGLVMGGAILGAVI
ncbi:hypothetical protein [Massilia sp. YMA4]|uniref:TrbC/VirB2 family protein n=1 Tax=[Empedobacter] haloabium TaxID=592317 RepID=A0ABZ1URP9_9BURK|nr:hypothetical protein [Massilia sp. YMA4]